MRLLDLWRWWREYGAIFTLPNLDDSAAFRTWCGDVLGLLSALAELTKTTIDDMAAAALSKIVADDDSWDSFYTVLTSVIELVSADDADSDKVAASDIDLFGESRAIVNATADKTGMDPVTIISLILMVARLIKWLRENRKGE